MIACTMAGLETTKEITDKSEICVDCGECIVDAHTFIYISNIGESVKYTVLSFPVFQADLQRVRYSVHREDIFYDSFFFE